MFVIFPQHGHLYGLILVSGGAILLFFKPAVAEHVRNYGLVAITMDSVCACVYVCVSVSGVTVLSIYTGSACTAVTPPPLHQLSTVSPAQLVVDLLFATLDKPELACKPRTGRSALWTTGFLGTSFLAISLRSALMMILSCIFVHETKFGFFGGEETPVALSGFGEKQRSSCSFRG